MNGFPYPAGARRHPLVLLLSPFGRVGRVTYLRLTPLVIVACGVLFFIGIFTSEHGMFYSDWQIFGPALFLLFTAGGSLMLRRLHDIGFSSLAALLALLPRAGWFGALPWISIRRNDMANDVFAVLLLADILVMLVLVIWPGQVVANRHGPVPD